MEQESDSKEEISKDNRDLDMILQKLEMIWEGDLDKNISLSKRGLSWLGIKGDLSNLDDLNPIDFLNKMVDLGKLISEDEAISSHKDDFSMSVEEARKMRSKLTSNKEFMEALTSKGNMKHKEVIEELNKLNSIIAKDKNK